jgi:hypothetical protein
MTAQCVYGRLWQDVVWMYGVYRTLFMVSNGIPTPIFSVLQLQRMWNPSFNCCVCADCVPRSLCHWIIVTIFLKLFPLIREYEVAIIAPKFGSEEQTANTDNLFNSDTTNLSDHSIYLYRYILHLFHSMCFLRNWIVFHNFSVKKLVDWRKPPPEEWKEGYRLRITYKEVPSICRNSIVLD